MKVLSIEQMTRLKQLGVDVTPKEDCLNYKLKYGQSVCEDDMKAFGLQDVIELLPKEILSDFGNATLIMQPNIDNTVYVFFYEVNNDIICWFYSENILDAAYLMLIWVIENGHLKTKTI